MLAKDLEEKAVDIHVKSILLHISESADSALPHLHNESKFKDMLHNLR